MSSTWEQAPDGKTSRLHFGFTLMSKERETFRNPAKRKPVRLSLIRTAGTPNVVQDGGTEFPEGIFNRYCAKHRMVLLGQECTEGPHTCYKWLVVDERTGEAVATATANA